MCPFFNCADYRIHHSGTSHHINGCGPQIKHPDRTRIHRPQLLLEINRFYVSIFIYINI